MSNVYDFKTGEPVKAKKTKPQRHVVTLLGSLHQRQEQIQEIMVIYVEKTTGEMKIGMCIEDDYSARALVSYLEDYVRGLYDPE